MKYIWICDYEKSWGADYEKCNAMCRKPFSSQKEAKKSADSHRRRTGHNYTIVGRDGRELKGWNKK